MNRYITFIALFLVTFSIGNSNAMEVQLSNPDGSSVHFDVEIAESYAERKRGLKWREHLPEHKGMLFIFEHPRPVRMWMKDTPISLDMIFFDENLSAQHIEENTKAFSRDVIGPVYATYRVLEIPAGSCDKHGITIGTELIDPSN